MLRPARADQLKTEFLGLATHQLRSPLTVISGKATMLLDGSYGEIQSEEQRKEINNIFQFTSNLIRLIEDLLNISKIEQGGMKYEMTNVDLKKIVEETVTELKPLADKKGLQLILNSNLPDCFIKIDSIKIRQVLMNIIDNAVKYTKKGFVNIDLLKNKNLISIIISDTGVGMTKETNNNLFQKFYRSSGSEMNVGGSGLGLYLAKEIITAHHGKIEAESKGKGLGSKFTIAIPNSSQ